MGYIYTNKFQYYVDFLLQFLDFFCTLKFNYYTYWPAFSQKFFRQRVVGGKNALNLLL